VHDRQWPAGHSGQPGHPAGGPLLMRKLADADPGQVRRGLLQVASLAGLMQVVPAHDVTAYDGIPRIAPALDVNA